MKNVQFITLLLALVTALVLVACGPQATEAPAATEVATEAMPEPTEDLMPAIGSEEHPIKVLFVPSVDTGVIVTGGEIMADALNEATGLTFEVVVPTSYAATIEAMCASPTDTITFIPPVGYILANQLCGVDVSYKAIRFGFPIYWSQVLVLRDGPIQTVADLDGKKWGYTDATSTSGRLLPLAFFESIGITPGEAVETGGHTAAVKALYNGEVDFATTYYSVPLSPDSGGGPWWTYEDWLADPTLAETKVDLPDDVVVTCAINTEKKDRLYCGEWRPLDARPNIRTEAPDVIQKIRILTLTNLYAPNDALAFGPEFPEDLRAQVVDALFAFSQTEAWGESIGNNDFYGWSAIEAATDAEYDDLRIQVTSVGLSLESLGE